MEWKLKNMRPGFGEALVELGKRYQQVVALNADLSGSTTTDMFDKVFPERFFNVGVAEQNLMGIDAGLASTGKIVFPSTFAMFAAGRAYDQIRQSIAYPKLNVKIVATHAGISVGGDGASHQMHEDLALMRVLPHMTVIAPADYWETKKAVLKVAETPGPCYMRLGRTNTPLIYDENYDFTIGKADLLRDGDDVTIIAVGLMVYKAIEAAEALSKKKISARVVNMSTIKPLDKNMITDFEDFCTWMYTLGAFGPGGTSQYKPCKPGWSGGFSRLAMFYDVQRPAEVPTPESAPQTTNALQTLVGRTSFDYSSAWSNLSWHAP